LSSPKWCALDGDASGECISNELRCMRKGKFNVFTSKHYNKILKGEQKCSEDDLCVFDDDECISKVFWCNRKGKLKLSSQATIIENY
jgi:hypothetical protein